MKKCILPAGLVVTSIASGCGALGGPEFTFKPEEATIKDVRAYVKKDVVSCRQLAERYQLLHDSFDSTMHGIVSWNDHLIPDAERLDDTQQAQRGAFHCVPVVFKDNIDYSGLPTTGGAAALGRAITGNNAAVADRLVAAGALVLGKANMPDFALDGTNTLSSFGGQTPNPYNRALTVYGSSGGNAAAISASLGIVSVGSDTYGSLLQPASATGLVAIRPTQGLVSTLGMLPLMSQQDMPGPMTRTVEDAAATLELLVDKSFANQGSQNYTAALDVNGLRGLKIGFDPALLQPLPAPMLVPSQEVVDLFSTTLSNLQKAGATTKQVDAMSQLFPVLAQAIDSSFKCMPVDFKESYNGYLANFRKEAPVKSLADVIKTGQYLPSVKGFLDDAQSRTDSIATSADCQQFLADRAAANRAVIALLDKEGLDLFVYPAANQPAFPIGKPQTGWYGFQALSSNTGLPSLTLPMGIAKSSAAPVGFVFLSRAYQEARLVAAAYSYQETFKPRTPPNDLP